MCGLRSAIVQGAERRQQFASLTLTERDTKNKLKASETRHDRFARDARWRLCRCASSPPLLSAPPLERRRCQRSHTRPRRACAAHAAMFLPPASPFLSPSCVIWHPPGRWVPYCRCPVRAAPAGSASAGAAASVRVLADAQRLHGRMSAGRRRTILGSYPGGGAVVSHQCVGSSCPSRDGGRAVGGARQSLPPRVRDHWWREHMG